MMKTAFQNPQINYRVNAFYYGLLPGLMIGFILLAGLSCNLFTGETSSVQLAIQGLPSELLNPSAAASRMSVPGPLLAAAPAGRR